MYELRYTSQAEKYFKKIKEKMLKAAYFDALSKISVDPHNEGEKKTGNLAGIYCRDVYYNKTNYEIAYRIYENSGKLVVVILAGTRESFYKELKRYMSV